MRCQASFSWATWDAFLALNSPISDPLYTLKLFDGLPTGMRARSGSYVRGQWNMTCNWCTMKCLLIRGPLKTWTYTGPYPAVLNLNAQQPSSRLPASPLNGFLFPPGGCISIEASGPPEPVDLRPAIDKISWLRRSTLGSKTASQGLPQYRNRPCTLQLRSSGITAI